MAISFNLVIDGAAPNWAQRLGVDLNGILARLSAEQATPPISRGAISGLLLSNNAAAPNTKVDIAVGQARDSTDTYDFRLATGLTVDLGTVGANGRDTITAVAANTTYHLFVIRNASGALAGLASTSSTSPTMPAGHAGFRRLGAVRTDGSANVRAFRQVGDDFDYKGTPPSITLSDGSVQLIPLAVPAGIKVEAKLQIVTGASASAGWIYARDPDLGTLSGSDPTQAIAFRQGSQASALTVRTWTNASTQIYYAESANMGSNIYVQGWTDKRDQFV